MNFFFFFSFNEKGSNLAYYDIFAVLHSRKLRAHNFYKCTRPIHTAQKKLTRSHDYRVPNSEEWLERNKKKKKAGPIERARWNVNGPQCKKLPNEDMATMYTAYLLYIPNIPFRLEACEGVFDRRMFLWKI